jgi:hypothetical protein
MTGKTCWLLINRGMFVFMVILSCTSTSSAEWKEKVLYSFQGVPDGAVPTGGVVFDKAGNLYGATGDGGASTCDGPGQCGTVYQLKPPAQKGGAWTETVLYIFKGHAQNDGATPEGGLVIDAAGNLYGTTGYGGSGPCLLLGGAVGCGTVYELSPPAKEGGPWTETVLYSFQGGEDGYVAWGDLLADKEGNLYGATFFGGGKGTTCDPFYGGQCGTVFKLSPPKQKGSKWAETVLHSFAGGTDGANPNGGLVIDSKSVIYGTTSYGGNQICKTDLGIGCGTVFKLVPPAKKHAKWQENLVHRFSGGTDGSNPSSGLTFNSDGALFGTGGGGTHRLGAVFEFTSLNGGSRWIETVIYSFTGGYDGRDPIGPVTFDAAGNVYGTTSHGAGEVFRLRPPASKGGRWSFAILYLFGQPFGSYPTARLIWDKAGSLISTTEGGGTGQACQGGCGAVFALSQ